MKLILLPFSVAILLTACVSKEKYESLETIYQLTKKNIEEQQREYRAFDSMMLEVSASIDAIQVREGEMRSVILERKARPDKQQLLTKLSSIDSFVRQANDRIFYLENKLREASDRPQNAAAPEGYDQLKRRYTGLLSLVEKLKGELARKEAELATTREMVESLKGNVSELTAMVQNQKSGIEKSEKELQEREKQLTDANNRLIEQTKGEIELLLKEGAATELQGDDRGIFKRGARKEDYQKALRLYRIALERFNQNPVPGMSAEEIQQKIQQVEGKLK